IVHGDVRGKRIRHLVPTGLCAEVEEAGIIPSIGTMEHCEKALVYVLALEQFLKTSVLLDSTVLAYAEKKNAVDGPLHGYIELINGEGGIPDSDVFCKNIPPLFDLGKNGFINGGGPFLAFSSFDKFIKRTPQDTFLRKDGFDPTPLLRILLESEIRDSGSCSIVSGHRLLCAVI